MKRTAGLLHFEPSRRRVLEVFPRYITTKNAGIPLSIVYDWLTSGFEICVEPRTLIIIKISYKKKREKATSVPSFVKSAAFFSFFQSVTGVVE